MHKISRHNRRMNSSQKAKLPKKKKTVTHPEDKKAANKRNKVKTRTKS